MPLTAVGRLRLPVVAAPMFLVSGPDLVIACCRAGVVGSFPALNQRTTAGLEEWLTRIQEALGPADAPFAVNLIVHSSNRRLDADLEVLVRRRVPVVITSLGAASEVVDRVHSYGGLVWHDVTTSRFARKAAEAGVDGLVLVAAGAGGHAGSLNPFAFLTEVRSFFSGTLLLAGGLSTGSDVLAAVVAGADLAYLGTRFLATKESLASPEYRRLVVEAGTADVVLTPEVSTIPANFLRASLVRAGFRPEAPASGGPVDLTHLTRPSPAEVTAWRDVWSAGQGVGGVTDVPGVAELVERLSGEYAAAAARARAFGSDSRVD